MHFYTVHKWCRPLFAGTPPCPHTRHTGSVHSVLAGAYTAALHIPVMISLLKLVGVVWHVIPSQEASLGPNPPVPGHRGQLRSTAAECPSSSPLGLAAFGAGLEAVDCVVGKSLLV